MIMENLKEKIYNWIGMKAFNASETFKNTVFGIYYRDALMPKLNTIKDLKNEIINLKLELNSLKIKDLVKFEDPVEQEINSTQDQKPKKKRKYTKRKKEVKE